MKPVRKEKVAEAVVAVAVAIAADMAEAAVADAAATAVVAADVVAIAVAVVAVAAATAADATGSFLSVRYLPLNCKKKRCALRSGVPQFVCAYGHLERLGDRGAFLVSFRRSRLGRNRFHVSASVVETFERGLAHSLCNECGHIEP